MKLNNRVIDYEYTSEARIDWITLSSKRPKKLTSLTARLNEMAKVIDLFGGEIKFENQIHDNRLDSICKSIQIRVDKVYLQTQFRGTFWLLHGENAWPYFKNFAKRLIEINHQADSFEMKDQDNNWRITRTDIRRDYFDDWFKVLPINEEIARAFYQPKEKYKFNFEPDSSFFTKGGKKTGISYYKEKWKLNLYRKDIETKQSKDNKSAKNNIYQQIIKDRITTRVELRIDTAESNSYANFMLRHRDMTETEFGNEVLAKWARNHRCMISKRKQEPRWEAHFNGTKSKAKYERLEIRTKDQLDIGRNFAKAFATKFVEEDIEIENAIAMLREIYRVKQQEKEELENSTELATPKGAGEV